MKEVNIEDNMKWEDVFFELLRPLKLLSLTYLMVTQIRLAGANNAI